MTSGLALDLRIPKDVNQSPKIKSESEKYRHEYTSEGFLKRMSANIERPLQFPFLLNDNNIVFTNGNNFLREPSSFLSESDFSKKPMEKIDNQLLNNSLTMKVPSFDNSRSSFISEKYEFRNNTNFTNDKPFFGDSNANYSNYDIKTEKPIVNHIETSSSINFLVEAEKKNEARFGVNTSFNNIMCSIIDNSTGKELGKISKADSSNENDDTISFEDDDRF